jgi:putative phosphoserine phosphatase/1-acylglycerol-3-phosphate O-acyltransferase
VAHDVVPELLARRQPYVASTLAGHRAAGRALVLATTTPLDLIEPFARAAGFDHVIATRLAERDGVYTGQLDGPFVWSTGKLAAVRQWAQAAGVALGESWAYSDSFFDAPLLGAVGHPVAVNPDPRLAVLATARRWPIRHLDLPAGVPKLFGIEPQRALLAATRLPLFPYARFHINGLEHLPASGPVIVCANHRSYFDVAALAVTMGRTKRTVRFMGKKELFDAPLIGPVATAMGGIRVDRGTGAAAPLTAALGALLAGELVAVMPQGTIPRGRDFFEPKLKGRLGVARLVEMARVAEIDVTVIPIGLWGTEHVWPRSDRLPRLWNVLDPPTVQVTVGEPVRFNGRKMSLDTQRLMDAIAALLPHESTQRHEPSDAELARTFPGGRIS